MLRAELRLCHMLARRQRQRQTGRDRGGYYANGIIITLPLVRLCSRCRPASWNLSVFAPSGRRRVVVEIRVPIEAAAAGRDAVGAAAAFATCSTRYAAAAANSSCAPQLEPAQQVSSQPLAPVRLHAAPAPIRLRAHCRHAAKVRNRCASLCAQNGQRR